MPSGKKYIFGPVPSRRLGRSLGVDIVLMKVCTLDCIYCQLGKTGEKTTERKSYVPIDSVLSELRERIDEGVEADYITISGSGEPTLNSELGKLIDGIREISEIPIAILTNGTLFTLPDVRADCAKADLVLPSLDAGDEEVFCRINRPHPQIGFENLVQGLIDFRKEYSGPIWLEVFMVEGVNTDIAQLEKIKFAIARIRPDKIQLNTAVRPTAERGILRVEEGKLQQIALQLGLDTEVIAEYRHLHRIPVLEAGAQAVLEMLKRRPCSLDDICSGLGIAAEKAMRHLANLGEMGP